MGGMSGFDMISAYKRNIRRKQAASLKENSQRNAKERGNSDQLVSRSASPELLERLRAETLQKRKRHNRTTLLVTGILGIVLVACFMLMDALGITKALGSALGKY